MTKTGSPVSVTSTPAQTGADCAERVTPSTSSGAGRMDWRMSGPSSCHVSSSHVRSCRTYTEPVWLDTFRDGVVTFTSNDGARSPVSLQHLEF
jgi:hypothetical protein